MRRSIQHFLLGQLFAVMFGTVSQASTSPAAPASPETLAACAALGANVANMVAVPAGTYRPFFKNDGAIQESPPVIVPAFRIDAAPVSQREFLSFLCSNAAWRRSNVKALFAEAQYLRDWAGDLDPGSIALDQPVTYVSWFAARAYCAARGARLPTVIEWERVGGSSTPTSSPRPQAPTSDGTPFRFAMGLPAADLQSSPLTFAGVWEWNADFNSVVAGKGGARGSSLFCGDGFRSNNASDYAAFLRHSFRSSLRGNYTLKNLGFRCVGDVAQ